MAGTLYLVATPIGNLQDISFRAIETLKAADLIACEDTRHTRKLMNAFGIESKLVSYHEHNERERSAELIDSLKRGVSVAVVSDAGTPGINDPGFSIVRAAADAGIEVVSIPGPVAFVNAAIVSGIATDSIFFGGFLPSRKSERRRRLDEVKSIAATLVFYESPHRLAEALKDCLDVLGDRRAALAREITKLHEETRRGSLAELATACATDRPRGEFVIVIERERGETVALDPAASLAERVAQFEDSGMERKAALKAAAREFGVSRSEAYRQLQEAHRQELDR